MFRMDDRTQPIFKTKLRGGIQDMIFPDFPDDENTVTTTITKSRRVSFGTNLVKEFIVGSAVSAQCVSEYEQAFSSSDSSNANSSYSAVESGILDQNTFVLEEKSKILQPIPPPNGSNIPEPELLERTQTKRPKFASTICFSADSPTADIEFTEGCLTLAKSILDKKNKEMTVIIQAKPKEEEKGKEEETKYFDGSQFEMSTTKCFKPKENKREEKRFEDEKTRIFSNHDDDMSMTKCDKLFRMRQSEVTGCCDYSDESMEDDSKENQIPLDLIMRHVDKDNTDFEKFLFHPQKLLSDVLNANLLEPSNDSEKLNMDESMCISNDFQSELLKGKNPTIPIFEEKTVGQDENLGLNTTKTIEERLYVSREEIILREEHLVLVQKERESLTGIRIAYESLEEDKEEPEEAEMEITLTGTGNVISDAVKEKVTTDDVEPRNDTEGNEDVSKAFKNTIEDIVVDKSVVNEKVDESLSREMEVETKEIILETPKEQIDVFMSREEMTKFDVEDERDVITNTAELTFAKEQQQQSCVDVSIGQISDVMEMSLTKDTESKELGVKVTEEQNHDIEIPLVETEEQKHDIESSLVEPDIVETSLTKPEEKRDVEMTADREEEQQENISDIEITLPKQKTSKEMSFDEVLKEITKEHEDFDEKTLEKYFEKDPEGDLENFLEKDIEDVEMHSDLEELNDDSVNRSELSLKESPKCLRRDEIVIPAKEVSFEKSEVVPEASKGEKLEREPPLADAKVIQSLKDQSKETNCIWSFCELSYKENDSTGFMSFTLELLESSTRMKFSLKTTEEDSLDACSAISSAEIELNPNEEPRTKDYKSAVEFGFEKQRKYFHEEQKVAKTIRHVPYFLDQMNSFTHKLNVYLRQIHAILSLYPGSRLKGSVLSFRLFSYPFLFSSTVSIDLTNLFRLSKSCLSFNTELGSLNEKKITEIFEDCLKRENCLCKFVTSSTRYIMELERGTGHVSKRNHIRLLSGDF